ncbi:MAG: rhodanese [Xanthomonadales bacterium]|nr:rhodanese [Xanthomonadales bacterium]
MMTLKPNVESLFARAEQAVEQRHADDIAAGDLASYLVLDVREDAEYQTNRLAGAISLPRSRLEMVAAGCEPLEQRGSKPVLVYCKSGRRSLMAASTLKALGIENPVSMTGGISAWIEGGKPVEGDAPE